MINADFCAGAVLISFGAVLGKTGPAQLLLMALLEVTLFGVNEFVLLSLLGVSPDGAGARAGGGRAQALGRRRRGGPCTPALHPQVKDAGGSMTIHTFGAYFGLVLSRVLYRPQLEKSEHRRGSVYHSDLFAMIGEACQDVACWGPVPGAQMGASGGHVHACCPRGSGWERPCNLDASVRALDTCGTWHLTLPPHSPLASPIFGPQCLRPEAPAPGLGVEIVGHPGEQ